MIKMNIIQRVEIEPISQALLETWIREKIAEQNPAIYVEELKFVQRRDPARTEVEVSATVGTPAPVQLELPVEEPVAVEEATEEPVVEPQTEDDVEEVMALEADEIAELEAMDSPFETDMQSESVIDEIEEQSENTSATGLFNSLS